jgi:chromosome segregation ATPase
MTVAKSPTERLGELDVVVSRLTEQLANLRRDTEALSARLDRLEASHNDTVRRLGERATELAVAATKVELLVKKDEEADKRRWGVWVALVTCLLTLVANLALLALRVGGNVPTR